MPTKPVHACTHAHTQAWTKIDMFILRFLRTIIYVQYSWYDVHESVPNHTHTHTHIYIYIHIHMCLHTPIYMYLFFKSMLKILFGQGFTIGPWGFRRWDQWRRAGPQGEISCAPAVCASARALSMVKNMGWFPIWRVPKIGIQRKINWPGHVLTSFWRFVWDTPKWMVYHGKSYEMDDVGVPILRNGRQSVNMDVWIHKPIMKFSNMGCMTRKHMPFWALAGMIFV